MREKRQKTRWTLYSFSNRFIFKGIVFFTGFLPLKVLRAISFIIALIFYPFLRKLRKSLRENYSLFIKEEKKLKKISKKCIFSYTRGVADFWYGAQQNYNKLFKIEEKNVEPFFNSGNILLTAHTGNWELGAIYLKALKVPFVVFAQPEEDTEVERLRRKTREKFEVETYYIDSGESLPFVAKRILQEGKNIIMLGDRAYRKDFLPVKFFGEKVAFLKSPFLLAKWISVPIYPIYFMFSDGKYEGFTFEAIKPSMELEEMAQRFARTLENILENFPEQWYNFFPYLEYSKNILRRSDGKL
ncbi:MAG: lysophospholipid acyltransferase family protein [Thermoanaerobaculia bacterium]